MAEAHRYDIDVSSPTSVGTVPLKALVSRRLRDREARVGEPSGTHTHTPVTHPKIAATAVTQTPIPSGGDTERAHTHARDATRTPSRRGVSTERGGEGCGQHAEMAEAHRVLH